MLSARRWWRCCSVQAESFYDAKIVYNKTLKDVLPP